MARALILGDAHIPYHSKPAFRLIERILGAGDFSEVVSVGDWCDMYAISRFDKSRDRRIDLQWEVDESVRVGERLMRVAPDAKYTITFGNHEARWEALLASPQGAGLGSARSISITHRMSESGWHVIPYKDSYSLTPHLKVTHDFGSCGKTAVFAADAAFDSSLVFGHTHRAIINYQPRISGSTKVYINAGWLGDTVHLDYAHRDKVRRDSVLGVTVVDLGPRGLFSAYFVPFIEVDERLHCCYDGKWYSTRMGD